MAGRRRIPGLLMVAAALCALVTAGCGDDSPVTPGREPLVYTGQLASEGFDSYSLPLERGGTVRIEVAELTPIFLNITNLSDDADLKEVLTVGVGIGQFNDEEVCQLELRPTLAEGRSVTVLLSDDANCLAVFDSGQLPPSSRIAYTVVVTDAAKS